MEKKMTYSVAIDNAINGILDEETVSRLTDLKASLAKRQGNKKPAKDREENIAMANTVIAILESNGKMSASEIFAQDTSLKSTPKVVSLLGTLINEGKVVRTVEKGKPYFELA